MELGKYLGKGIWGLADKALPALYGVGYVVLVIRVLPEQEFGNFVLVQEIFLIISALAGAFALQPLLKFAAEESTDVGSVLGAALFLNVGFVVISALLALAVRQPLSWILNSSELAPLMMYLPALLAASFVRNYALTLLQTRFLIKEVFWTDAIHFLGAPLLIWIYSRMHRFNSALDLIDINVISLSASSVLGLYLCRPILNVRWKPSKAVVRNIWDYGRYSLGGIVSYLVYSKADTFVLSAVTGPVQVAVYSSVKVFVRVYDMVSQVIQMFILPATSKLYSQGEYKPLKVLVEKAILFSTVGLIPVFLIFLVLPSLLVSVLYSGRYTEAVPLLRVFSLLSFVIPVMAVGLNMLMGIGEAKLGFLLGIQMLAISVIAYLVLIPLFGTIGAATGYVVTSYVMAWATARQTNRFVPVTPAEVLRRTNDIKVFLISRFTR